MRIHFAEREYGMSWRRLLAWAAVAVAAGAVYRSGWIRGSLATAGQADTWWQAEMLRLIDLRDREWRQAMDAGMTLERSDLADAPIGEWLN